MKNILITGCAGFIGFHLSKMLVEEGHTVIGVDNLYQDINADFKMARLRLLLEKGLLFHDLDITDSEKVKHLLDSRFVDTVVHLAARTGVRQSIINPFDYIEANIKGFCTICEAVKSRKPHLIYASSSSVYGASSIFPYTEKTPVEKPLSVYAATKKSDELFAHFYAQNYQLKITGLRFFTVYGPWNRKDMAVYLFMDAISKGKPIRLFNHGKMERDFTYVDDITASLARLINKEAYLTRPLPNHAVYNIGFGEPVSLDKLVSLIEHNLGKKAIIEYDDLQPGDMVKTWADNSGLSELIGYTPKVSIEEGIKRTTDWFLNK